jgi:transposase
VEQFELIRRAAAEEGLSVRALARRFGVHRRSVRQALADAVPPPRKVPVRVAPVSGSYMDVMRGWLVDDQSAPRKQRHTARRVWQRLLDEHGADLGESTVRRVVARLRLEVGSGRALVMVPQTHGPAEEAEVDFGEFQAVIDGGEAVKLWMFVLRLSHSGRAVHIAYGNTAQESFLDGHVKAFAQLGGVPTGMIRYDNLTPAVIRVLLGRDREQNPRFVALRSHYRFESFFCIPGKDGAHEKGGVEGEIGRFRRGHLTPMPKVASLAALNEVMAAADAADNARHIGARRETVGAAAAREQPLLRALPDKPFDPALTLSCRIDAKARVCVRQSYYSAPAHLSGRRVTVLLGADNVRVVADGRTVAVHVRSLHKGTEDLVLDHYLEVLVRKPGALAGSTALVAARACGAFTPIHQRFWDGARRSLGDGAGTRALIAVLLLHRTLPAEAVIAAMAAALGAGRFDADLLAVEARRQVDADRPVAQVTAPAGVPGQVRALPTLAGYDELLTRTSA